MSATLFALTPASAEDATDFLREIEREFGAEFRLVDDLLGAPGSYPRDGYSNAYGNSEGGGYYQVDDYRRYDSYGRRGHGYNQWGQSKREVERLCDDAIRTCKRLIKNIAYERGFYDVDFDNDFKAEQFGPYDFQIKFREVEFEGKRRDYENRVTCVASDGYVEYLDGLPSGHRGYDGYGYSSKRSHRGYSGY